MMVKGLWNNSQKIEVPSNIDINSIPKHIAIIMDGNADGPGSVCCREAWGMSRRGSIAG